MKFVIVLGAFLSSILCCYSVAWSAPVHLVEIDSTISISDELWRASQKADFETIYISNKSIVAKSDLHAQNSYCRFMISKNADRKNRQISNIKYIAGESSSYLGGNFKRKAFLDLRTNNGQEVIDDIILQCESVSEYSITTENLFQILGDYINFNFKLSPDVGGLFNFSSGKVRYFTLLNELTISNENGEALYLKNGVRIKESEPNSLYFSNVFYGPPKYYKAGEKFYIESAPYVVVNKSLTNFKKWEVYTVAKIVPLNSGKRGFTVFINSDRNAELSFNEVTGHLQGIAEFTPDTIWP